MNKNTISIKALESVEKHVYIVHAPETRKTKAHKKTNREIQ